MPTPARVKNLCYLVLSQNDCHQSASQSFQQPAQEQWKKQRELPCSMSCHNYNNNSEEWQAIIVDLAIVISVVMANVAAVVVFVV